MISIGQGTTAYLEMQVEDMDLRDAEPVVVTIAQGRTQLDLTGERVSVTSDGTDSVITVHLTQEEAEKKR